MNIYGEYLDLARLAMSGRTDDVLSLLRRSSRRASKDRPEFKAQLSEIISSAPTTEGHLRRGAPSDSHKRSHALQRDSEELHIKPIWPESLSVTLDDIVAEHRKAQELKAAGIAPSRTLLLVGPPGVGKTLAARWIADRIRRELHVIDLASLMSSRLGETGNNLRSALSAGANESSVLLLDEFDSIGKRRDDERDIGELKRLVNVLLQAMDRWPPDGLLIAATNHPELLDRAVWRRFDRTITFPRPDTNALTQYCIERLAASEIHISKSLASILANAFNEYTFAELEIELKNCIRSSIIHSRNINGILAKRAANHLLGKCTQEKLQAVPVLIAAGVSQRETAKLLGISRDTIRKYSATR